MVCLPTYFNENFYFRRFKALQNLVTTYYQIGQSEKMIDRYRMMLQYMSNVTRNECTDAINIILDTLQSSQSFDGLDLSEVIVFFRIIYFIS